VKQKSGEHMLTALGGMAQGVEFCFIRPGRPVEKGSSIVSMRDCEINA
jgi:hypothetical protein